jgi:hypothetical protein
LYSLLEDDRKEGAKEKEGRRGRGRREEEEREGIRV